MVRSLPLRSLCFCSFSHQWLINIMVVYTPTYISSVFNVDIRDVSIFPSTHFSCLHDSRITLPSQIIPSRKTYLLLPRDNVAVMWVAFLRVWWKKLLIFLGKYDFRVVGMIISALSIQGVISQPLLWWFTQDFPLRVASCLPFLLFVPGSLASWEVTWQISFWPRILDLLQWGKLPQF